eukprot:2435125-Prymnesium_polylepis.2
MFEGLRSNGSSSYGWRLGHTRRSWRPEQPVQHRTRHAPVPGDPAAAEAVAAPKGAPSAARPSPFAGSERRSNFT